MAKALFISLGMLFFFLGYSIYSYDLKIKDVREYERKTVIYTKSQCQFCDEAKILLSKKNIHFSDVDITWDKELHQKLIYQTNQTTVPYIFINGNFVGGYRELEKLINENGLDLLINNNNCQQGPSLNKYIIGKKKENYKIN